jgi:3-oxoacyl-[acyl-carrier-protein] synthase II
MTTPRPTNDGLRVVVTGMGAVTPLGLDVATTWEAMVAGRSGVGAITAFDPSRLACRIAGEVKGFDCSSVLDRKEQRRNDRYVQFSLVAARQAMDQAGLPARLEGEEAERVGVFVGTGIGGIQTLSEQILTFGERGPDRLSPFMVPMSISNLAAGAISIAFGPKGPNFSIISACATGAHAIGEAFETIRRGDADVMLAGGSEAGICEVGIGGFVAMRALSTRNDEPQRASRPFDRGRDGFVMAEGCGIVVLESLDHARRRGVEPLAELRGYGATADASHITLPAPGGEGAVRAIRRALAKAGLRPDEVAMVNAHAPPTPEGDSRELEAMRTVFGERAGELSITANKSLTGHSLGAAGAIEAIATIMSIRTGIVPPTINLDDPDEASAGLDLTPGRARRRDVEIAVSNSFGFGGQNSALVFRRWAE